MLSKCCLVDTAAAELELPTPAVSSSPQAVWLFASAGPPRGVGALKENEEGTLGAAGTTLASCCSCGERGPQDTVLSPLLLYCRIHVSRYWGSRSYAPGFESQVDSSGPV